MIAHLDYEFRSGVDITDVGSHRTSIDPRFELFMAAVSREGDPHVYLWINPLFHDAGVPHENEAAERILAEATIAYAHNAPNEQANTWGALQQGKACPFKTEPPITIWRCTAAEARKAGLPYSLDKLCAALGLVDGKDRAGKALIKFFSAPKDDGTFNEPRDFPEKWAAFCNYCRQDVRAEIQCGEKLKPFQLTGAALATFQFDLRMNQRGIPINLTAARNAQRIIDEVQAGVRDEFRALTGLNVTQRDKFKTWLGTEFPGRAAIPNLQSETVQGLIDRQTERIATLKRNGFDHDGAIIRFETKLKNVLTMYQSVSYAAVKKVSTMLDCACPDGRVRGGHMYYGAGTGRWSGKLLQPHNFKKTPPELRPYSGKIYEHLCRSTNAEVIDELFCSPLEGIASSIRHFIHDPKTAMLDGDYSGVEARIIAWLAGQEDVLQEWRDYDAGTGLGPYKHMAAVIYGIGAEAVTKDQREIGKRIVLGCFGPDTLVVTSRGLKAITHITCEDWLWDGVDWVRSDGVIYQGCKDTIQLEGVTVTENHSVLSGRTWHEAGYLAHDGGMTSRALATALGSLLSSGSGSASAAEFSFTEFNALVDRALTTSTLPVSTTGLQRDAIAALRSKLTIRGNDIGVTQTSSQTELCESVFSTAFLAALPDATVRRINNFIITVVEEYLSIRLGGKTGESFSDTLSRLLTTTKLQEILTGKTSIEDMNPATSGSPQSEKTSTTGGRLRRSKNGSKSLNGKSHVYDVANAGPRSRFTIWTDNGPLIVHNCGFQMGPDKFQESCRVQYGLDLPMELCVKGIKAFRRKCDRIRDYWWSLNNSAISAIRNPGATFGAFTVRRIAGMSFLMFRLRSGRALAYPHPEVNMVKWVPPKDAKVELDEFGDPIEPEVKWREEITYWGQIPGSQQWGRIKLYGGKLAENETQATAADFMAHGAITAEARGMPPFMLVHDQGLALKNGHTEAEFERALGDLPAWAKGFPMKVEVGTTPYFTKE